MKIAIFLLSITVLLGGCSSIEDKMGKEFICTYHNSTYKGKFVGYTTEKYMLSNDTSWSIADIKYFDVGCKSYPIEGIVMLSGYEHLQDNFTR